LGLGAEWGGPATSDTCHEEHEGHEEDHLSLGAPRRAGGDCRSAYEQKATNEHERMVFFVFFVAFMFFVVIARSPRPTRFR